MLEAFEPVLIRTPGETSQAKNRKILPTTYGGVRQTCMHAEMATATSASMAADGIGSNRISAAPRRGGEIHHYHASFGLRHPCSTNTTARVQIRLQSRYNTILHVGFRPTTISLLWRGRKATCNIALYSATLPYVIRIVTTGQRLRMSSCDRGLAVLYNSMQVLPPPTQYRGIVVGSENTQHRVIQHKQTNNSLARATSAEAAWSRLTTGSMQLTAEAVR